MILEEFKIPFPNDIFFSGKSVNDILYIWELIIFIFNIIITHSISKKWKIVEINEDDVEDIDFQSGSETFHLNT